MIEEDGGFNLNLVNDPDLAEQNFILQNYDLVFIGFRMPVIDGFDLYKRVI